MKLYREWVMKPEYRKGSMLPVERFKDVLKAPDPGYASVYAFEESAALEIIASKRSAGFSQYPAWSDMLMIDLDDGDRQLRRAEAALQKLGLGYRVWSSGSKGFHIGIPLKVAMFGLHVPYSQRKWVEDLDVGADLSLYQHGRILSLPGRVHPKTGRRKAELREVMGETLSIPMLEPATPVFAAVVGGADGDLANGLWQALGLVENEPEPGNRHTKLWSTAKSLADAGMGFESVVDLLTLVNEEWENSKPQDQLLLAIQQAYKK